MSIFGRACAIVMFALALFHSNPAQADEMRHGGKMLLTSGVTSVEGAGGGGLASWALITGNETNAGVGGSVHITHVPLPQFDLTSVGGAIGFRDRVELSYAHHVFDTRAAGATLGLGRGFKFEQDIFGAKIRVLGDAVYDQDKLLPQIAIGVQHKRASQAAVIRAVGGKEASGTDFYVAATKVVLSRSLVLNATIRVTKANQFGLLGFGGDLRNKYRPQLEASAGVLVTRNLLLGGEFRTKPSNLGFARENHAHDVFAAWSVARNIAVTVAYVDLGDIATVKRQRGAFLSLQGRF